MATIIGRKSYLVLGDESAWGTVPGTPTYVHTPVNSWDVKLMTDGRQATPYTGNLQERHNRIFRARTEGTATFDLYGYKPGAFSTSLLAYMLNWGFAGLETSENTSKFADWAQGPDTSNKQFTGLRCSGATVEGSEDAGAWTISLNLSGKDEVALATAQTVPNDREKLAECLFQDSTFALGGSAILLSSFRMETTRNISVKYNNASRPSIIAVVGPVSTTVTMVPQKTADTYDVVKRLLGMNEYTGQAVIKGLHNGTGTGGTNYTVATIDFPRLSFVDKDDQDIEQIVYEGLTFRALKPDTSSNSITLTYTEAS